jgi:nucleoside-diphosphate-sugar epimerase
MIVITGSDGIVGRALCESMRLLSIPFLPITHCRKPHTSQDALLVDLADTILPLERYIDDIKVIVHLAAAVPHSINYPDDEVSANKTRSMDRNILALHKLTNAHIVYMSTCGLYNRNSPTIKNEINKIKVTTPYFAAKASGEEVFKLTGSATILRLAAPIGIGLKPNLVLSKFITEARCNKPIKIWGSGQREQNFIDSEDVSKLILKVVHSPVSEILNVASETSTTMLALAETVVSVLGKGSVKMVTKMDPLEAETARYAIKKTKRIYDWMPEITLEQSIEKIASENFENNV